MVCVDLIDWRRMDPSYRLLREPIECVLSHCAKYTWLEKVKKEEKCRGNGKNN
jgi:hypothetical protein